jgi:hypothetical protein
LLYAFTSAQGPGGVIEVLKLDLPATELWSLLSEFLNEALVQLYGARFRQEFTLEDAIGSHACLLQVNMRVTDGIPLGCPLF